MLRREPVAETGHLLTPLYRRPSRLRRLGALLLTAGGAAAVACGGGGGGDSAEDPGQVWVETDGAAGRINLDDVQQAYRDAYGEGGFNVQQFEQRVNEIYEGDNLVLIQGVRDGDTYTVTGWEDLNTDQQVVDGQDDKLFTITQELKDGGGYTTQGYGANGYYNSFSPFGGFFTGLLIGNLLSGGFGGGYVTPASRYDDLRSSRASYRNSGNYASQQARNASYGSSVPSRFGNAANQSISPARSSYQSRQINSGGFRSSGSTSRSIGSGSGSISGGGGRLAL